jgi:hypothetical protein
VLLVAGYRLQRFSRRPLQAEAGSVDNF